MIHIEIFSNGTGQQVQKWLGIQGIAVDCSLDFNSYVQTIVFIGIAELAAVVDAVKLTYTA